MQLQVIFCERQREIISAINVNGGAISNCKISICTCTSVTNYVALSDNRKTLLSLFSLASLNCQIPL